jgi:ankyrin repeat protein
MSSLLRLAPWTEYDVRDIATLKARIAAGADVNAPMHSGISRPSASGSNPKDTDAEFPLGVAAYYGNAEACTLLLAAGADPNRGTGLRPPLALAIAGCHSSVSRTGETLFGPQSLRRVIETLVCNGANPDGDQLENESFGREQSPIFTALKHKDARAVAVLAELGANLNIKLTQPNVDGTTPLHSSSHMSPEICRLLLALGADPLSLTAQQLTPLHVAAKFGNLESCRALSEGGGYNRLPDMGGQTPMHWAIRYNCAPVVTYFLDHCHEHIEQTTADGKRLDDFARNPEMIDFLRGYRNSLATVQAVQASLSPDSAEERVKRSNAGFSPI